MRRGWWLAGASLLACSALALAQEGPESLLPPGFDKPAPRAAPKPAEAPKSNDGAPATVSNTVVQSVPGASSGTATAALPAKIPSLDRLQAMSPEEIEALLGSKPKVDMPAAARRAMTHVGVIDEGEGGLAAWSLRKQNPSLVRAVLEGNSGNLVSRWGHILLRRALASRLDAPAGMNPADFAALRSGLLTRMGEGELARELVQDVDVGNYSPLLTTAAVDAYVATADFTGACPVVSWQGGARKDRQWRVLQAICGAFSGESSRAMSQLDRIDAGDGMEKIDLLLAQKYAGAGGKGRRAVTIEWDNVPGMTPWRYALTMAVGLEPPANLMKGAGLNLRMMGATAPMLPLASRAASADYAAGAGVLSSAAMVDLYSQLYAQEGDNSEWATRAGRLRDAYLADSPADRLAAIKDIWGKGENPLQFHSRQVLTAQAAARLPVSADFLDDAPGLIAAMLSAGLDANALRWGIVVPNGSLGWGQLVLVQGNRSSAVSAEQIDSFHGNDESEGGRKTQFLVAALAGMGRLPLANARELAGKYDFDLDRASRWSQLIDGAADAGNVELVALLAGVGMQGSGWNKMTPRHLFHIIAALHRVGLTAEARMIAAESVARG